MTLLVIGGSDEFRYAEWLKDYPHPVVAICAGDRQDSAFFAHFEKVSEFRSGVVEQRAIELNRDFRFSQLFAPSEHDLIRAARLRRLFGIPGQSSESAHAFRDKATMKDIALRAGVRTAAYARLQSPVDLLDFVEQHGYPVVVKPVDGAGSRNVQVLREASHTKSFLGSWPHHNFIVETFIRGALHHADGFVVNGQLAFATASRYIGGHGCLSFRELGLIAGALLPETSTIGAKVIECAYRTIRALPPAHVTPFHAEVFVEPSGEVLLCEIASRVAGNGICDAILAARGLDMRRTSLRLQCGLAESLSPERHGVAGYYSFIRKEGIVQALPELPSVPWVTDFDCRARIGQRIGPAAACVDDLVRAVVHGDDTSQIEQRIASLHDSVSSQVSVVGEQALAG